MPPTAGSCRSATTSPPTSATSTRGTSRRWCGRALTALSASSIGVSCRTWRTRRRTRSPRRGVTRGDRVAVVLPPTPETAAIFFGVWKLGAILLSMSVLYGDDGIEHRLSDSQARVLVTDAENAPRFDRPWAPDTLVIDEETLAAAPTDFVCEDTAADDPAQLYYTSGTTGLAKGIVHAHRYILAHEEFTYCHEVEDGEKFHGMGEWAWAAGIAPLLGPWRLGAVQCVYRREAGFDPHRQLVVPQPAWRHERVHDADGDAVDDGDRGRRLALSAGVPPGVLGGRAAQPRGDPLVPRAVRRHGARLLRSHRVVPARGELPVDGGARGVDGEADAGLGRADPRRGRAAGGAGGAWRDLPAGAIESPLPARLLAQRRGGRRDVRRRVVPHEGCSRAGRGRLLLVRRPRRRRDHRRRLPDRPVRGRVGLPRAPGRPRGRRRGVAR